MLYSQTFSARKGPLGTVWGAAHLHRKLTKSHLTSIRSRNPNSFVQRQVVTINCSSNSQKASPFTEKHSNERHQRDSWMYKSKLQQPSCSCPLPSDKESVRDHDIALQLPELKKLIDVMREEEK